MPGIEWPVFTKYTHWLSLEVTITVHWASLVGDLLYYCFTKYTCTTENELDLLVVVWVGRKGGNFTSA